MKFILCALVSYIDEVIKPDCTPHRSLFFLASFVNRSCHGHKHRQPRPYAVVPWWWVLWAVFSNGSCFSLSTCFVTECDEDRPLTLSAPFHIALITDLKMTEHPVKNGELVSYCYFTFYGICILWSFHITKTIQHPFPGNYWPNHLDTKGHKQQEKKNKWHWQSNNTNGCHWCTRVPTTGHLIEWDNEWNGKKSPQLNGDCHRATPRESWRGLATPAAALEYWMAAYLVSHMIVSWLPVWPRVWWVSGSISPVKWSGIYWWIYDCLWVIIVEICFLFMAELIEIACQLDWVFDWIPLRGS